METPSSDFQGIIANTVQTRGTRWRS
jgi:hypothetical protein